MHASCRVARWLETATRRRRADAARASSASATRRSAAPSASSKARSQALLERDVAITLYTREWPRRGCSRSSRASSIRSTSAGCGATRASRAPSARALAHARRRSRPVARAARVLRRLPRRRRRARRMARGAAAPARRRSRASASRLSPHHRYLLAMERRLFASPRLRAVICNSRDGAATRSATRFGVADERLHVIYNAVDCRRVHAGAARARAHASRGDHGIAGDATLFLLVGSGYERKGVADAIEALARRAGARAPDRRRRATAHARATRRARARSACRGSRDVRRPAGRSAAVLRRGRRVRAADALRSAARTPRSRRWPAGCRSSPARGRAPPSSRCAHDAGFVCAPRATSPRSRRTCARCSIRRYARRARRQRARRGAAADAGGDDGRSSCAVPDAARAASARSGTVMMDRVALYWAAATVHAPKRALPTRAPRLVRPAVRSRATPRQMPPQPASMTGLHLYRRLLQLRPPLLVGVRPRGARHGRRRRRRPDHGDAGDPDRAQLPEPRSRAHAVAAARGRRRVPAARHRLVRLRVRHGVHRATASCSTCAAR